MSENKQEGSGKDTAKVTLIIFVGLIILACVLGFSAVSVAFFLNPPW